MPYFIIAPASAGGFLGISSNRPPGIATGRVVSLVLSYKAMSLEKTH